MEEEGIIKTAKVLLLVCADVFAKNALELQNSQNIYMYMIQDGICQ